MMRLFGWGHLSTEELSAYLDRRGLDRGHLEGCEVCQGELASLEATRGYLSALREVAAPRSFMPVMVEPVRGAGWGSWLPAMRMATAGVAALLVVAVGVESYAISGMPAMELRQAFDTGAPAAAPAPVQEKAAAAEAPRAPAAAPQQGALRSAPVAAVTAVVVQEEAHPHPSPLPQGEGTVGRVPGPVSAALGVVFLLLGAATIGLWIRERR